MMVYVWSRRNPFVRLSILGLFTVTAPYLPWVLFGFAALLHNTFPLIDAMGILVGHVYFFLQDIYPATYGQRVLKTPAIL